MENEELPQYMRIAGSVAGRIAEGQFAEGKSFPGGQSSRQSIRSLQRRSARPCSCCADMQVVTVKEQSRVYVRSAENAKRYLQMIGESSSCGGKKQKLRALLAQQEAVARQVSELCGSILDDPMQPIQAAEQLQNYACRVPQDWSDAGRSLGSLHFWQATGATVVAIRRAEAMFISPGPYAELYGGRSGHFCGRPGGPGGCRPVFQENGSNMSPAGVCLPEGKDTCGS